MPKESVTPAMGGYAVRVGWSPNREVQVGVETENGRSLFWTLLDAEKIGRLVQDLAIPNGCTEDHKLTGQKFLNELDTMTPLYAGLWADLDREDCNRLIRLLRKARDSAYGKDE